jgi:CrcB protein
MSLHGFVMVGLGAAIGAWFRWLLALMFNGNLMAFPVGTLLANLIGSYFMGLLMALFTFSPSISAETRLFLITVLLGGLTTFSSFSGEAMTLLTKGQYAWAGTHIALHVVGSLAMTGLGLLTVHMLRS